jgi:hypothetical protein
MSDGFRAARAARQPGMGVTKQYLRYAPHSVFNVIGSGRGGGVYLGWDPVV